MLSNACFSMHQGDVTKPRPLHRQCTLGKNGGQETGLGFVYSCLEARYLQPFPKNMSLFSRYIIRKIHSKARYMYSIEIAYKSTSFHKMWPKPVTRYTNKSFRSPIVICTLKTEFWYWRWPTDCLRLTVIVVSFIIMAVYGSPILCLVFSNTAYASLWLYDWQVLTDCIATNTVYD